MTAEVKTATLGTNHTKDSCQVKTRMSMKAGYLGLIEALNGDDDGKIVTEQSSTP